MNDDNRDEELTLSLQVPWHTTINLRFDHHQLVMNHDIHTLTREDFIEEADAIATRVHQEDEK